MVRPVIKFFQCLSRFPHFDARFTVASCGPNSPIGRMLFAAGDQNSHQLNLLLRLSKSIDWYSTNLTTSNFDLYRFNSDREIILDCNKVSMTFVMKPSVGSLK